MVFQGLQLLRSVLDENESVRARNQQLMSNNEDANPLVTTIGISGPMGTGKTAFVALILETFAKTARIPVIYIDEDEFLKKEDRPADVDEARAYSSLKNINIKEMQDTIRAVQLQGSLPISYQSSLSSDKAVAVAQSALSASLVERLNARLKNADIHHRRHKALCLVKGPLLFHLYPTIWRLSPLLDLRLFLPASYQETKQHYLQRNRGESTQEDHVPLGSISAAQFDQSVWPCFVQHHKHLFDGHGIDGSKSEAVNNGTPSPRQAQDIYNILIPEQPNMHLEDTLEWAFNHTLAILESRTTGNTS